MSENLVKVQPNQALVLGGLGMSNSRLFQLRPATIELVQKTSRQEGAIPGKFRITSTNEHFDQMRVVLLAQPIEQRVYYLKNNEFSNNSKLCFSLDAVRPHPRAKEPQAINCSVCSKGDSCWKKWYETHKPEDLPPCKKYWHCVLADRTTQMIYYLNIRGTSIAPFEQSMQNLARLFAAMTANVNLHNKKLAEGQEPMPMPNLFDITFTLFSHQKEKGGPWNIGCKDFAQLKPEDRKEFGALFLEFEERRRQGNVQDAAVSEEEAVASAPTAAVSEVKEVESIAKPIEGEYLPPDAGQITI